MKKIISCLLFEIFLFTLLILVFPALVIKEGIGTNREGGKAILAFKKDKFFTQELDNPTGTLDSISLQLKNPLIKDNSLIEVDITDSQGSTLQNFTFYGANIADPSWIKLKFAPISYPHPILKISADNQEEGSLYLYADDQHLFDIKTTYRLPSFKNRLLNNFKYQLNLFQKRSPWHNLFYSIALISFNIYLAKLIHENSKKD